MVDGYFDAVMLKTPVSSGVRSSALYVVTLAITAGGTVSELLLPDRVRLTDDCSTTKYVITPRAGTAATKVSCKENRIK